MTSLSRLRDVRQPSSYLQARSPLYYSLDLKSAVLCSVASEWILKMYVTPSHLFSVANKYGLLLKDPLLYRHH